MGSKWLAKGQAIGSAKAESSLLHVASYLVKLPPNQGQRSVVRWEGERSGGDSVSWWEKGDGGAGKRKGDVLIVDGSGADSCNDLICLCVWRWKDWTPPERMVPSFSVNRVNYLYNEICKVVNFSSSLFLPPQLFTLPHTFKFLSSFPFLVSCPPQPTHQKTHLCLLHLLYQLTSFPRIWHFAQIPFPLLIFTSSSALYSFSDTHSLFSIVLRPLLLWPYLSLLARAYWYIPTPSTPPPTPRPTQGAGAFNIQSMPSSSEPSFSSAGFDRQVPPSPSASISITAHERGMLGGKKGRREKQSTPWGQWSQSRQTDGQKPTLVVKAVLDGLKGLPLLGTWGTDRLTSPLWGRRRNWEVCRQLSLNILVWEEKDTSLTTWHKITTFYFILYLWIIAENLCSALTVWIIIIVIIIAIFWLIFVNFLLCV